MKWFRMILAAFLLVGMLLGISSVAYAHDGDDDPSLVVEITIDGENPEVWINGRNLNEPTAVYNITQSGVESSWVKEKINQALTPLYSWMDEYGAKTELSAAGLAKVILLIQENESQQILLFDEYGNRLTDLESNLEERIKTLEVQDAMIEAQRLARDDYLTAYYDRALIIIIGAFALVVIGLATGLGMLWRRTRV